MAVEMLSYLDRKSPIHHLTGVTKLLCFIMWSFAAMLTYDTRVLLLLLVVSVIVFMVSKVKIADVAFILAFILLFLLINNIAIYIFSPEEGVKIYKTQHVIFSLAGRYNLTIEQLFYQMNITLKYLTVIPAALLFMVTTHPSEFASSLNRIGVSYSIAFSVAIALRYIPDIQRDYRNIALAQQARGLDMSHKEKMAKRMKNAALIIFPLILSSLDRIETISNAMDLRGFGKNNQRTWYSARPFKRNDYVALFFIAFLFVLSITVTFYDGDRFYNPFL
ncbi:energy-coupling factor transporter transmembrane component T family protein [Neobacillus sp. Marseille-QA0830]